MVNMPIQPDPDARFTRSSWLIAGFSFVLLVYSFAYLAYGFTLPTDGWEVNENVEAGFMYTRNMMGVASELRPGDNVIAVEGYPVDKPSSSSKLKDAWHAGATLRYTVIREGREIKVAVTLVHFQFQKWLLFKLRNPYFLAIQLSSYFMLALAFLVFRRRPGNLTAGAFLLLMTVLASTSVRDIHSTGLSWWVDPLANAITGIIMESFWWGALSPYVFIHFALVFPHPKPILLRYPWLDYVPVAIGLVMLGFHGNPIGWFWFLLSLVLTVAIFVHNAFTMRNAVSRAQISWGLGGLIIGIGWLTLALILSTFGKFELPQDFFDLVSAAAFLVMGVFLAVAITRYRLFDIDLVIRRTLQYTLVTGLLALVYFGGVALLQGIFSSTTGEHSAIAIIISTLAIAALFNPLRRRVQDFIDRGFYRRKYNAEQALAEFAAAARSQADLEKLTEQLTQVVDKTMQPERLTLWLRSAASRRSTGAIDQTFKR